MRRGGRVGAELVETDGFAECGDGPDDLDDTGEASGDADSECGGDEVRFVEVEEDCAGDDLEDVEDDGCSGGGAELALDLEHAAEDGGEADQGHHGEHDGDELEAEAAVGVLA